MAPRLLVAKAIRTLGIDHPLPGCYADPDRWCGGRCASPTQHREQGSQLSSSDHTLTISENIEVARTRLISLAGLLVAVAFFTIGLTEALGNPPAADSYLRSLFAGGLVGLVGLGLSLIGNRRASSLLLATGLTLITTWQLLVFQLPYEVGLAAYVGVLLVSIVGASQTQVQVATAATVACGLYTYLNLPAGTPDFQGALAICGLLAAAGITLSWLQDNLLRAIGQLESSSARLQKLSQQDPLTGLGNRRLFDDRVGRQLPYISGNRPLALVIIDVDQLKSINDRHGHPVGDQALLAVADAIRASTRESDSAARLGGDEFGILLPTGGMVGARRVADRIHEHLNQWSNNGVRLSVSIGIAEATDPQIEMQQLLHSADSDMYAGRRGLLPRRSPNGG